MRLASLALLTLVAATRLHSESKMGASISQAEAEFQEATEKAFTAYRRSCAAAIASASKIEVYLLDFEMASVDNAKFDSAWAIRLPDDQFPIVPYGASSKILKRKMLTADELKLLKPSLQATIGIEKNMGGAFCHYPIHGVRIWDDDAIVFQTSICYQCLNFYMTYPYPFGDAEWTSLNDAGLDKVMSQLMPIPQAEIDRFKAKNGPQNDEDTKK